jgi:diguanylate cyclase (GGDEF)-like protein
MHHIRGITGRITFQLVVIVTITIMITAAIGYTKLYDVTETNASIRIDRAARAAASIFTLTLPTEYEAIYDQAGDPLAVRLKGDTAENSLMFREDYDALLKSIGATNQGAANLFKLNMETNAFDRFSTTFRRPDGSMPPPMSIKSGHPAYDNIINNRPHLGEVPVMGRMRLAYLTPVQFSNGQVAGALAVDVGWVDDLIVARNELRSNIIIYSILILLLVAAFGIFRMSKELLPIRSLAKFAEDLAQGNTEQEVPFKSRKDEIGTLAQSINHVAELQNKLAYLAYTDELTGLGNRSNYLSLLDRAIHEAHNTKNGWVLMHLDIDGFKQINDMHGQIFGDVILKKIGEKVVSIIGENADVSRLASDEFTILINEDLSERQTTQLSQKLIDVFNKPMKINTIEIFLTVSIGITFLKYDAESADEAHRNTNLALRQAKDKGGDQYVYYASCMNDLLQGQIRLERYLQSAISNRKIEVHFQPQVNPMTNTLTGLEALARWNHATKGPISPAEFIPIAESSGMIVELGTLILDLACEQAASWRKEGFDFKHISVNVSPIQLWQGNFIDIVKEMIQKHGILGSDICIEITEGIFVDHTEIRVTNILNALRELDVILSLDDFGMGYSSLGYLNRLPFDQLKIDRSFVSGIDKDHRKQHVLQGVISLGKGLHLNVVVEGAETQEEVNTVKDIGCDSIQGFYYAKPAKADLIPHLVEKIQDSEVSFSSNDLRKVLKT